MCIKRLTDQEMAILEATGPEWQDFWKCVLGEHPCLIGVYYTPWHEMKNKYFTKEGESFKLNYLGKITLAINRAIREKENEH